MNNEYGEPILQCAFHPLEEVVGVCASCLRERLQRLKIKNDLQRGSLEIVYSSDSDSSEEIHENGVHKSLPDNYPVENREATARTKFMWMAKANKFQKSGQKKDRRTFSALRSFFHRLRRNKDIKQDACLSHEDSFISIKFESINERSSWVSSMIPSINKPYMRTMGVTTSSSARHSSVSEHSRPSLDDIIMSKRSSISNYYDKETTRRDIGDQSQYSPYDQDSRRCSNYEVQDNIASYTSTVSADSSTSALRWRTRVNHLFHMKCRDHSTAAAATATAKDSRKIFGLKDINYINQYPNSKIWSLSTLNNYHNNNHDQDHRSTVKSTKVRGKRGWLRTLTSPKWSLH
eukprot:Gb_40609 [translate_table: standard]